MKKLLCAGASAVAIVMAAQPAFAADLPVKAPPIVVEVWNWNGWYLGINGGYSWGRSRTTADYFRNDNGAFLSSSSSTLNLNGPIFGGQVGFNRQNGNWVWGLEADLQWSGQRGSSSYPCTAAATCNTITGGPGVGVVPSASFNQSLDWFGTLRARLGTTLRPTTLAYVTGGLAVGGIRTNGDLVGAHPVATTVSAPFSYTRVKAGWTVGGGLESRLSGNWTGKIEYIFADYGTVSGTATNTLSQPPLRAEFRSRVTDHVLRVGINYKWGDAIVARY